MKNNYLFHWSKHEKRLILCLSIGIIAVLLWVFSQTVEREMAKAEEVMFSKVVAELNAMLVYKTAENVALNQKYKVKNFVNHNPMDWMKRTPVNYSENIGDDYSQVAPGQWFFAPSEKAIVYRVMNTELVEIGGKGDPEFIKFRVVLDYIDVNKNAQFDELSERIMGLKLEPLQKYQWFAINTKTAQ